MGFALVEDSLSVISGRSTVLCDKGAEGLEKLCSRNRASQRRASEGEKSEEKMLLLVGWLLRVPVTCGFISRMVLFRHVWMLLDQDRNWRSNWTEKVRYILCYDPFDFVHLAGFSPVCFQTSCCLQNRGQGFTDHCQKGHTLTACRHNQGQPIVYQSVFLLCLGRRVA